MPSKLIKKIARWIQNPFSFLSKPSPKKTIKQKPKQKAKPKKAKPVTAKKSKPSKTVKQKPAKKKAKVAAKVKKTAKVKKATPVKPKQIKLQKVKQAKSAKSVPAVKIPKAKDPGIPVGTITHYFPKAGAAVLKVEKTEIKTGAKILIKGSVTNLKMTASSIQINRIPVPSGRPGEDIGIGVKKPVCVGDSVYLI